MGCFGSKAASVESYAPEPDANDEFKRSSNKAELKEGEKTRAAKSRALSVADRGSNVSKGDHSSKRNSRDGEDCPVPNPKRKNSESHNRRKSAEEGKIKEASAPAVAKGEKPIVQRRKSTAEASLSEMRVMCEEVQPFAQVEVRWKLKGVKANEADWIGMYPGLEIPADIDIYSSSMMATGKTEGMVKFTAPNHPGLHHFRYFLLDDSEAAVSAAFTITKIDKAEAETNIHVRDAMLAENEVQKIEGTYVESDEEEEVVEEDGTVTVKKKKKKDPVFDDVTGFEVDENSTSVGGAEQLEKWKKDEQAAADQKTEQVMHAATNYVKKIPTKKEMRAASAAKVAQNQPGNSSQPVNRGSQEASADGAPKKKGWGALRGAVKATGAFQQGRAKGGDDSFKNRKAKAKGPANGGGEDMGSFVINRTKK